MADIGVNYLFVMYMCITQPVDVVLNQNDLSQLVGPVEGYIGICNCHEEDMYNVKC